MNTAIDIVLLPSDDMMDKAIKLNRSLSNEYNYEMGRQDYIPHISLSMSCIHEDNLPRIYSKLKGIAESYSLLELKSDDVSVNDAVAGKPYVGLKIKMNPALMNLQRDIREQIGQFLNYEAGEEMFVEDSDFDLITIDWVKGWEFKKSEDYNPHMSIGFGHPNFDLPIEFVTDKIAVCKLGNYCTCRKILKVIEL